LRGTTSESLAEVLPDNRYLTEYTPGIKLLTRQAG
jgi:hypothetical protein